MGLPVVATDVGGTREAVVNGETGHLVPSGDAVGLAQAIRRLASDPDRARAMGHEGRLRAERLFSRDAYLRNYQQVLAEALLEAGARMTRRAT